MLKMAEFYRNALNVKVNMIPNYSLDVKYCIFMCIYFGRKKTTGELFHIFEAIISGALLIIFLTGAHVPAEKVRNA